MKIRAGDWVEVRSKAEILQSLDEKGCLEGLPFMPKMFQYCGQRFKVYKRAHKTCDTINPAAGRWLAGGIHLPLRCDGKAHGGCDAACLLFWKEAWLKPIDKHVKGGSSKSAQRRNDEFMAASGCWEENVWAATRAENHRLGEQTRYICQATQLPYFTTPLRWWDPRQYIEDYVAKNTTLARMFCNFVYAGYYTFAGHGRLGRPFRWLYDRFQKARGGVPYPRHTGRLPAGTAAPTVVLNLQPGELVRVKSYNEILDTLDSRNSNRGLSFDAELVPYCGGAYRVKARVEKFVDEKTGTMSSLKTPAVILEDVYCQSRYSYCRVGCPRSIYSWWREVWLERVSESKVQQISEKGEAVRPGAPQSIAAERDQRQLVDEATASSL